MIFKRMSSVWNSGKKTTSRRFGRISFFAEFEKEPLVNLGYSRPDSYQTWYSNGSLITNNIKWPGVPFKILPRKSKYINLREKSPFWLNFKWDFFIWRSAFACDLLKSINILTFHHLQHQRRCPFQYSLPIRWVLAYQLLSLCIFGKIRLEPCQIPHILIVAFLSEFIFLFYLTMSVSIGVFHRPIGPAGGHKICCL